MIIAAAEGLTLSPPSFAEGLDIWSRGEGRPGSASYEGGADARIVEDPDFGPCLELDKTAPVQRLRHMGETPILPGRYLRVTFRAKAVAGPLPGLRVAGWAGTASSAPAQVRAACGAAIVPAEHGAVVEASAIVGTGMRLGVEMPWGVEAVYGHLGLDLTGPVGGTVRIADLRIEDVTHLFLRERTDLVDVRDYGALGDGVSDDAQAFEAADRAARGRTLLVPEGVHRIGRDLVLGSRVRFVGTVTMAEAHRLVLLRNFDLASYAGALGGELAGVRKALQALLGAGAPEVLDLCARRIVLDRPLDLARIAGLRIAEGRREIRNGSFVCRPGPVWAPEAVSSKARHSAKAPAVLSDLSAQVAVPAGALAEGGGIGREVFVAATEPERGMLRLSRPPWGAAARGSYTFRRFRYAIDLSGFERLSGLTLDGVTVECGGVASAVLLPSDGAEFAARDCRFVGIGHRGISSPGTGCRELGIERCTFRSEGPGAVGLSANCGGAVIRDSRFEGTQIGAILRGSGHRVIGNRFAARAGGHALGVVFAEAGTGSLVQGNRFENAIVEWTNEHDPAPDHRAGWSFTGLTVTGNVFFADDAPEAGWIVVRPHGTGHFLGGLSVVGNGFSARSGPACPVQGVDASIAALEPRAAPVTVAGNVIDGDLPED